VVGTKQPQTDFFPMKKKAKSHGGKTRKIDTPQRCYQIY